MGKSRTISETEFAEIYEKNHCKLAPTAIELNDRVTIPTIKQYIEIYEHRQKQALEHKKSPISMDLDIDVTTSIKNFTEVIKKLKAEGYKIKITAEIS